MYISSAKIDWKVFEYIHSSNVREAFQELTEQMFCFEFNRPYGIYRYYNQPYIETMPIHRGNEYIGFQSKYYDASTSLADRESELISAVEGAFSRYPGINKLIFYTNKEVGMSTAEGKQNPAYIDRIVNCGDKKGIKIEWRGLNELETMLLNPSNVYIRDYFFETAGGIRKAFEQIKNHTNNMLNNIENKINYHGQTIKILHDNYIKDSITNAKEKITVIHGDGGCGKSALVKDLFINEKTYPIWFFKATDFNCPSVPEFARKFGDCTWDDMLSALDEAPNKLCVIDSAEKAFSMDYQNTLSDAVRALLAHGWKLLITIRSSYLDNFLNLILYTGSINEVHLPKMTTQGLDELERTYGFSLPQNPKTRNLLQTLFYLNLYLSKEEISESQTISEFYDSIWKQVICNSACRINSMHTRRNSLICKIVRSIGATGVFYYIPKDDTDWDALSALCESDILQYDEVAEGYFITHDVYEELVIKHIISQEYSKKTNNKEFFVAIGDNLLVRKNFRIWVHDQFEIDCENIQQFLLEVLQNDEIATIWKDEILIAMMNEDKDVSSSSLDAMLKEYDYSLLVRGMHLLNTACKIVDDELCQKVFTADEIRTNQIYRFMKPSGKGWNYLISFVYLQREYIPWSAITISLVAETLYSWVRYNPKGVTTREAGLMALFLYKKVTGIKREYVLGENQISKICEAILFSAYETNSELSAIFERVIDDKQIGSRDQYYDLCKHLLKDSFNTGKLCEANPDLVIELAKCFWLEPEKNTPLYNNGADIDIQFGLKDHINHSYYPTSAFQTPILSLLNAAPEKAIAFIIELIDAATFAYKDSRLSNDYNECCEIEIKLPKGKPIKQIASHRLWQMHRGMNVNSNLLSSVLMALERWLYYFIKNTAEENANMLCLHLLMKSHSAAITSVITSMVLAYPEKLFDIACILLRTKEILLFDLYRVNQEETVNFLRGNAPIYKMYDNERINTNNLPFRKKRFEDVIFNYQIRAQKQTERDFEERIAKLYSSIDEAFSPEESLSREEQFLLYRIDARRMKVVNEEGEVEQSQFALVSDLPDNLIQVQQNVQGSNQRNEKFAELQLWSKARFEHNAERYKKYTRYEDDPTSALVDGFEFVEKPCSIQISNDFIIYVAAVLLIDFKNQLDLGSIEKCKKIVIEHVQSIIEEQDVCFAGDGTEAAIATLPLLIENVSRQALQENPLVLLLMLICDWGFQRDCAIEVFREKMWQYKETAYKMISLFVQLKPWYDKEVSKHHGASPFDFISKHELLIEDVLSQERKQLPDYMSLNSCALITLNLLMPYKMDEEAYDIFENTGKLLWPLLFKNNQSYDVDGRWPGEYEQISAYIEWLAKVLLLLDESLQNKTIILIAPYLTDHEQFNTLLMDLICAQDLIKMVPSFWNIWNQLFTTVEDLCGNEKETILKFSYAKLGPHYRRRSDEVVSTYLLAFAYWKEGLSEWHTLRREDSAFFSMVINKIGYHPAVIYSIAYILNTIGSIYMDCGIKWLSDIIVNSLHLSNCDLPINTQYYIEEYVQHFCSNYKEEIKKKAEIRNALVNVLSFLVDRGSTCGYMLREKYC